MLAAYAGALSPCVAQDKPGVDVTASADKDRITIGGVVRYQVDVEAPVGAEVSLPDATNRLQPFEVRDYSTGSETLGDRVHTTFRYELQVFEVGEKTLGGLVVEYKLPDAEEAKEIPVPAVTITIASVLTPDSKDIKDIRDPVPIKMGREQWLAAALIALVVLGILALLAWLLIRRYRSRPAKTPAPVLIEAHERALAELDELAASDLLAAGQLKPHYTRLSEILREYLEARYEIHAMEGTTWMIQRDLARQGVDRAWIDGLVGLLRQADMVKFARLDVAQDEAQRDVGRARGLVEASRPVEGIPNEEEQPQPAAAE